jgi:predicted RND superfamily exporter protein
MVRIANFCARFPYLVLIVLALLTFGGVRAISAYLYREPDLTKFLPKDFVTIKADDYYRQNFNHQDFALVGVEADQEKFGTVWHPTVLRTMEKIVEAFKDARATKTFESKLTGKAETLTLPIGIDIDDVNSIANLKDIILDEQTNALRTGRINRSIKEKLGIPSKAGQEDALPESEADLAKLVPVLREHVMKDPLFRGIIVSEDERAALIQVPMQRKWDYMRRFAKQELAVALSEESLTARFKGQTREFPFDIWGKTIDGITVNEEFVQQHVAKIRKDTQEFLAGYYAPAYLAGASSAGSGVNLGALFGRMFNGGEVKADRLYPELGELVQQEMTPENFAAIMTILDDKELYQISQMNIWETSTNDLWAFVLREIDPFSREGLEFQVYDPRQFVEVGYNAATLQRVASENEIEGIKTYLTGYEYLIAQLSVMMGKDMGRLLPLAILVDILMLFIAFRSVRGVIVTEIPVVIAVIGALAGMALSGVPMSLTTFNIPIILLAVGTAYGIHILNRYYEDMHLTGGRRVIIRSVYQHVGLAVFGAGITTVAGFASFAVAIPGQVLLRLITHFGIFTALGTLVAITLAYILIPALLAIWHTPVETHAHRSRLHEGSAGKRVLWTVIAFIPALLIAGVPSFLLKSRGIPVAALFGPMLTLGLMIGTILFIALYKAIWFTKEIWVGPVPLKPPFSLESVHTQGTWLDRILNVFATTVVKYYKAGIVLTAVICVASLVLAFGNYFEGGIIYNFKQTTPIYQSDKFVNQNLSGSYSITMIFRFRPQVQLNTPEIVNDLRGRSDRFLAAWNNFAQTDPALQYRPFAALLEGVAKADDADKPDAGEIVSKLFVVRDALNEEFRVRVQAVAVAAPAAAKPAAMTGQPGDGNGSLDDLESLAPAPSDGRRADGGGDAELMAGLADIRTRMAVPDSENDQATRFIQALRAKKSGAQGVAMQKRFNELNDLFAMDVKQPAVLHKLQDLEAYAYSLRDQKVDVYGTQMGAVGFVTSPLNVIKKVYRVLYHEGDYQYDKLPEPEKDGLLDPTATERSVLGTVVNQAMSSDRDAFNRVIITELDQFLFTVLSRAGETRVVTPIANQLQAKALEIFPPNDPYIQGFKLAGRSPRSMEVTRAISDSQAINLASAVVLVGLICMWMFRSVRGGLYAMVPLLVTILVNFAVIRIAGFAITVSVMMVASIAIGTGVDYTLHFLERYKIQIGKGDDWVTAYLNTVHTSGKAIIFNAASVAIGFSVLLFSEFKGNIQMGVLMAGTMAVSSLAALTTLPAMILWLKPGFVARGKQIEPVI